jgi:alkylation response protein AidB-like acyl-CoA dehydrogenase
MDFSTSEEQQEVRDLARKILEELVTQERLRETEASDDGIDRRVWGELARANLLGVAIGEAWGGSDLGFFTLCILLEEIGRTVAPVPALPTLVLGALPIERFGSDAQKRRWLPGAAAGELFLSAALQEEGGGDAARPTTRARRGSGGFLLDGRKICVPAAHLASRILVPARGEDDATGVFLVDPGAPGVHLERQRVTDRQPHFLLRLEGARVADADVLGDPGQGAALVEWLALRATTAVCAVQVGVSERALRMTADYTASRVQFERPVGSFQAVHMRAADAWIQLEAMRLTTWDAAWRLDAGEPAEDAVRIAKFWAAEGGQFVGYAAQHLHGGIGIDVDYPLHRYYLWAKQNELTLGTASIQLEHLGARIAEGGLAAGS